MAMETTHFTITKHTIPAGHIREYPRATADDQEVELHLAVKQYVPKTPRTGTENDLTVIGAHANGFPKELYEPLWDDLFERLSARSVGIRSLWIADVAHQGDSGVLNEDHLGNDPSWVDHSRDLLFMINYFRKHMKRPIVGIGHSMGAVQLVNLAFLHPRLFSTVVLIEPVLLPASKKTHRPVIAELSAVRRDYWPTREAAEAAFKRGKLFQAWDPRVLQRWLAYSIRELPTLIYSDDSGRIASLPPAKRPVTLTTTRHHEVFTFVRPSFPTPSHPFPFKEPNRDTHPDITPSDQPALFYGPQIPIIYGRLPHIRPSVLYIFGGQSDVSEPHQRADKLKYTGVGVGGSGGAALGRVKGVTYEDLGHLIPMEAVSRCADTCADWIVPDLQRWRAIEDQERAEWAQIPPSQKSQMSPEFLKALVGEERAKKMAALAKGNKL